MRLEALTVRRVALPLVRPFRTSFGTQSVRDALVLTAHTDVGDGWGECVTMVSPLYNDEYLDGEQEVLTRFLLPLVAGIDVTAESFAATVDPVKGHFGAKAGLEMALLDAQLKAADTSFASYLGGVRSAVDSGVSIGITDSLDELLAIIAEHLDEGYKRIKLKIEPGFDVEVLTVVRASFPDAGLQVDANTAYTLDDLDTLRALDEFAMSLIEQPLPEDDLLGHAELAKHIETPICLDESIHRASDIDIALALGACSIVNIKAGRVGGYLAGRAIHDRCAEAGIPVWCGGMLETGLGRAANVALASLPNFTLPGDTSASSRYFHEDITTPFELIDGQLEVPTGPGLGVEIRHDTIAAATTFEETYRL